MTHGSKKLGRLVLGAILAAGAGIWTPSVEAAVNHFVYINADNNDTVTVDNGGAGAPAGALLDPIAGTTNKKNLKITGGTGAWNEWGLVGGRALRKH